MSSDLLIVGGGVIGLSIAWRAARRGARVTVLERGELGRESSWAAGGILPFCAQDAADPYDRAMGESAALYPRFVEELREHSEIDVEYRVCGEVLTELDERGRPALLAEVERQRALGAAVERRPPPPGLGALIDAYWLPQTAQLRPPRLLAALVAACRARGVVLRASTPVARLLREGDRVEGVALATGEVVRAERTVIAAGAWSPSLLPTPPAIRPLRGQIVLLRSRAPLLDPIVSVGHEYLVPRRDGRVLVGSTMEDVGFDARTTAEGVAHLIARAIRILPALAGAEVERSWAGLRPATTDGRPYVGPVDGVRGLWLAAGHTRQGIHLAPHTAETVASALSASSR